jgi:DNA-binding CsgD family transcriptional regulator
MDHLGIFALILSLPLGVAAVYKVTQAYKKYNQRYFYTFAWMLMVLNASVILNLVNNYIFANVYTRFASPPAIVIESIYRYLSALANIVWAYIFVVFCRKLLMKRPTPLFMRLYFGTGIPLVVALTTYFVFSLAVVDVFPILTINHITMFLTEAVVLWTIIYLLRRNMKVRDKGKQKAIRLLGYAMLISYSLVALFSMLHLYKIVSNGALVVMAALFLWVLYGMPVFFLRRFMELYHGSLEEDLSGKNRRERLFKKYNISRREQEIIHLICQGKSNKQIEDELYIALQTVKDHVSRIYHKTGVKNRVQLTNLFRD